MDVENISLYCYVPVTQYLKFKFRAPTTTVSSLSQFHTRSPSMQHAHWTDFFFFFQVTQIKIELLFLFLRDIQNPNWNTYLLWGTGCFIFCYLVDTECKFLPFTYKKFALYRRTPFLSENIEKTVRFLLELVTSNVSSAFKNTMILLLISSQLLISLYL